MNSIVQNLNYLGVTPRGARALAFGRQVPGLPGLPGLERLEVFGPVDHL